jgi:hypothetical protein
VKLTPQVYRLARNRYMSWARRAAENARLYQREGKPEWAEHSREQVSAYVRDARYFNRRAMQ